MRILTVTNLYPNPFHPQRATFNREQVRALACEHDVSVISPIAWTDELLARRAGCPPLPSSRRMEWDGVRVEYPRSLFIPRFLRGSYGRCLRWSLRRAFGRALREFRPDVIYATWAYPDGWAAVDLGHRAGLPVVLKVHGSDILELEKYPGRRRGTIEALQRADRVVAVSRDLARKVVELGANPDRVHLIYNGVDDRIFRPGDRVEARQQLGLDRAKPILLYIGNLLAVKGPDILIDACGLLALRGLEFDLHMIGKGPLRSALELRASDREVARRVVFHGPVAHDRLPVWFRAANMLVLPSRSEGVPNVVLEAAACRTPFVASRVGGVPEVAHLGRHLLVHPGDAGVLSEAIEEMLLHPPASPSARGVARTHAVAARELLAVFRASLGKDSDESAESLFRPGTSSLTAL